MREAVKILKALADPTRLRIIAILLRSEVCVCELMAILDMEQSRISHQLRILRDADIVEDRRDRRWIVYAIPERARPTVELLLENFLKEKVAESDEIRRDLAKIPACLEQSVRKESPSCSAAFRRTA
jgi:ArsR family transcriptional regulator